MLSLSRICTKSKRYPSLISSMLWLQPCGALPRCLELLAQLPWSFWGWGEVVRCVRELGEEWGFFVCFVFSTTLKHKVIWVIAGHFLNATLQMSMKKRAGREALMPFQDGRKIMIVFCDWTAQPALQNLLPAVCLSLLSSPLF